MNSRLFWLTVFAGSLVSILVFCVFPFPLGVPDEWSWVRIGYRQPGQLAELVLDSLVFLPVAAGWLLFVRWGGFRIAAAARLAKCGLVTGLWMSSVLLVGVIQSLQPAPFPQLKAWVLYYPQSSGYFHVARYEMRNVSRFLSGYEERMAQGDVLHVGTHPPGLFLFHRFLWTGCENSSTLSEALVAATPAEVADAFDVLEDNLAHTQINLSRTDRASLWLAMLLTQAVSVATIVPLYLLLTRWTSRETAWFAAACWPLIPSLSVFLPKSDALYPFVATVFLWLWVSAGEPGQRWRACAGGLVFWLGALLSLAMVPIGLIAGLFSGFQWFTHPAADSRQDSAPMNLKPILLTIGLSVGTFLVLTFAFWTAYRVNLFSVWLWNYHNHAGFYEQYTRTAWKWWLVNPLETAFAVGAPLAGAGIWGAFRIKESPVPMRHLLWSSLLVWGLIWISGKNSGEAARLWLVFFPVVCLSAGATFNGLQEDSRVQRQFVTRFLASQLAVCAVTVATVSGFHI